MKDVITLAREAGITQRRTDLDLEYKLNVFAALVREDFALKYSAEACGKCVIKQAYKDSEKELNALREISDKQGSFPEKQQVPSECEHMNQSVTHYSNETWIQHCESCGAVIKSGTYVNENGAVTNEVTTQQEPVAWMEDSIEFYAKDHPTSTCTIPLYTAPPTAILEIEELKAANKRDYENWKWAAEQSAALAARQMRDAAVKVCREISEGSYDADACNECANLIESIPVAEVIVGSSILEHTTQKPVPEIQWRDLTDDEFEDAIRKLRIDRTMTLRDWNVGRAVIAKFKEKQL